MRPSRQIKLGLLLEAPGMSYNSWIHPTTPKDANVNFPAARHLAELAEGANFAFLFVADTLHIDKGTKPSYLTRFEPVALLSALSAVTSRIGLVATISTQFSAPFTISRQIGSLDVMSGGRAGWNVVTSAHSGAAANYGDAAFIPHDERYAQAEEFVEVARGLWDSWDDDAFPRDVPTRRFADLSKQHVLDHQGKYYTVRGPLNMCRSAQGQPVTFQAGSSGEGRDFAAKYADAIFAREYDLESAKVYYADMKGRARSFGRDPDELQIFMGAQVIVGATEAAAEEKYETLLGYVSDADALRNLGFYYDHLDFTQFDPDAPFPDVAERGNNFFRGMTATFQADAARLGLSLRQAARRIATRKEDFFGSPTQVADAMEAWLKADATDGFLLNNWVQPDGLQDFVDLVVPELRRRGLYGDGYAGATLREHLGLPFLASRYAEERVTQAAE